MRRKPQDTWEAASLNRGQQQEDPEEGTYSGLQAQQGDTQIQAAGEERGGLRRGPSDAGLGDISCHFPTGPDLSVTSMCLIKKILILETLC